MTIVTASPWLRSVDFSQMTVREETSSEPAERASILVATKGLLVYLPPELFVPRTRAVLEAHHLAHRLGAAHLEVADKLPMFFQVEGDISIHVVEVQLPRSWRGWPLWLGLEHRSRLDPPLVTAISGDDPEAFDWFRSRVGDVPYRRLASCFYETVVMNRGQDLYVGVHHAKQVRNL